MTSTGKSFFYIRQSIIRLINKLNWKNGIFRKDIGWRVIKKNRIISGKLKGKTISF